MSVHSPLERWPPQADVCTSLLRFADRPQCTRAHLSWLTTTHITLGNELLYVVALRTQHEPRKPAIATVYPCTWYLAAQVRHRGIGDGSPSQELSVPTSFYLWIFTPCSMLQSCPPFIELLSTPRLVHAAAVNNTTRFIHHDLHPRLKLLG